MKAAVPQSTPEISRPRLRGGVTHSPLRRSGIYNAGVTSGNEDRNDDEAERSSLVASERTPLGSLASSTPHNRPSASSIDSINSSPQKEHFQGCLKLYAENKINKDNAWNLRLIDFMTSMLRRHDARMENLQLASTVVDASTRIYSFRVDAVHHEVMKMAGGLTKAAQAKRGRKDDDGQAEGGEGAADGEAGGGTQRRKKKKTRGAIAAAPEIFNGDFDANDCLDPFFERLAATTGDVTSSNRAFNATLPIHDQTLALILRMDDGFLEPVKENIPEEMNGAERVSFPLRLLPSFTAEDQICEPFTNFSISNWDPESEDGAHNVERWVEENRLNLSQQALAFDVNAEVEPIPHDEDHNDLLAVASAIYAEEVELNAALIQISFKFAGLKRLQAQKTEKEDDEPLGGIESDEEQDAAVAACVARLPPAPLARLTDMRPATLSDHHLEYSYCSAIVSAWAGPSHWRLKNNRASKASERTQSTNRQSEPSRRPARNKRQLDFVSACTSFEATRDATTDYAVTQPNKIMISRKTLAQGHVWSEKNYKTPIDRGLEESHFQKLFLKKSALLPRKRDLERQQSAAQKDTVHVADAEDYNYNNENDCSYCPNSQPEGEEGWGNEEGAAAGEVHEQLRPGDELGDMLEPPTKVAKIFIPYAMRAKKVDMKQLKHITWRILSDKGQDVDKEHVSETTFAAVYNTLPNKLSTNMREALSVPLALLSVLHLANEKGLILEKYDDNKNFGILGLIEQ